jgi:RHS repeat-associated protein
MQMVGRSFDAAGSTAYRYGFNGKENDNEVKGEGNQQDYGMRIYDPRLGRFLSVDPLARNFPDASNYCYSANSPIFKVDVDGGWDITVHAYADRKKYGYGIAIVTDRNGKEVFRFKVRLEGVGGRNRLIKDSDTPLGVYDIPTGKDTWIRGKSRLSNGPNARLALNGLSGEIKESKRSDIRIHGGRQEKEIKNENGETIGWEPISNAQLKKTHGCLRSYDEDIKKLKEVTDGLESSDKLENGGTLSIVADLLLDQNGEAIIPTVFKPKNPSPTPVAPTNSGIEKVNEKQPGLIQRIKNWFNSLPINRVNEFDPIKEGYSEPSYGPDHKSNKS